MTSEKAREIFEKKLDREYLTRFKNNELLKKGEVFKWENLNGVFSVTILDFDGVNIKFEVNSEKRKENYTINNFYIFNEKHLDKLLSRADRYYSENIDINNIQSTKNAFPEYEGVYIIHDLELKKHYVGKSKCIIRRMKEHFNYPENEIDKRIMKGIPFEIRTIPFADSGYSNLDALETAFIAYFNSRKTGYNIQRGNNGAGNVCATKCLK